MQEHTESDICWYIRTETPDTLIDARRQSYTNTCIQRHTYVYTYTYIAIHKHTYTYIYIHMHTHTY